MNIDGERTLPGRPEQIWSMLLDPDVLVAAMPGCEALDRVEEDHYTGRISAKVGSIESTYDATFKVTDKDPPDSYKLSVQGKGSAGFVKGDMHMEMEPAGDHETTLHYSGTANVGGRIAQVGQRMVHATATAMIDQGFEDLRARIQQEIDVQKAEAAGDDEAAAQAKEAASEPTGFGAKLKRAFRFLKTFLRALFGGR
jgi:carbon monoxide dehydrogenase subunit G